MVRSRTGTRGTCAYCEEPVIGRGMCQTHYRAWYRNKELVGGGGRGCECGRAGMLCARCYWMKADPLVRILYQTREAEGEGGGCWLWTGKARGGYGYASVGGRVVAVHRYVYERWNGIGGRGVEVGSVVWTCGERLCVNPEHMTLREVPGAEGAVAVMRAAGIEPLEPYPGRRKAPWKCRCPGCGEVFWPCLANVRDKYSRGCHPCGIKRREEARRERVAGVHRTELSR